MMSSVLLRILIPGIILPAISILSGCAMGGKPAGAVAISEMDVGHYPPPPAGAVRPRVAVPPLRVTTGQGFASGIPLDDAAADELVRLLDSTGRFNLIERGRLGQMVMQETLHESIEPGELLKPVKIPGVRFLLVGRVVNLAVAAEDPAAGFGVAKMKSWVGMGGGKNQRVNLTVSTSVSLLIEPGTGIPRVDVPFDYRRTASAAAFGINVEGKDLSPGASLNLNRDEAAAVLRVVLDDAVRRLLPATDKLLEEPPAPPPGNSVAMPATIPVTQPGRGTPLPLAARRICPECGANVSEHDEFCPNCGAKLP